MYAHLFASSLSGTSVLKTLLGTPEGPAWLVCRTSASQREKAGCGGPGKTQDAYWHLSLHSTDRETEGLRSKGLVYSS